MGHTNETTNLHLPQFIGSDKPTWLGDINGAFQSIDSAYATIEASASGAVSTANNAASVAQSAATEAASATSTAQSAATDAASALSTANNAAETANNAQSTAVLAKNEADEALAAVNRGSVSVTSDGVKTYAALFDELFALVDMSKVTRHAVLAIYSGIVLNVEQLTNNSIVFAAVTPNSANNALTAIRIEVVSSGSKFTTFTIDTTPTATANDLSSNTATSGNVFTIEY